MRWVFETIVRKMKAENLRESTVLKNERFVRQYGLGEKEKIFTTLNILLPRVGLADNVFNWACIVQITAEHFQYARIY